MKLEDFSANQQNQRMYGGTAGRKMGISYMGKDYLLKFPGNLKEQQMKKNWRQKRIRPEDVFTNCMEKNKSVSDHRENGI